MKCTRTQSYMYIHYEISLVHNMTLDWSQHCFVGIGVMLEYNRVLLQHHEHSVSSMQPIRLSNPGCQEYHEFDQEKIFLAMLTVPPASYCEPGNIYVLQILTGLLSGVELSYPTVKSLTFRIRKEPHILGYWREIMLRE